MKGYVTEPKQTKEKTQKEFQQKKGIYD